MRCRRRLGGLLREFFDRAALVGSSSARPGTARSYLLTIVRLAGPGGARLLVAESVLKELIEQDPDGF